MHKKLTGIAIYQTILLIFCKADKKHRLQDYNRQDDEASDDI